jgi:hypothetical protein
MFEKYQPTLNIFSAVDRVLAKRMFGKYQIALVNPRKSPLTPFKKGGTRVVSYKKRKMHKPTYLVTNRPELKFGLIAKVH